MSQVSFWAFEFIETKFIQNLAHTCIDQKEVYKFSVFSKITQSNVNLLICYIITIFFSKI